MPETGRGRAMVSGYDKNPPEPRYEPDPGPGCRTFWLTLLCGMVVIGIGWWLLC